MLNSIHCCKTVQFDWQ